MTYIEWYDQVKALGEAYRSAQWAAEILRKRLDELERIRFDTQENQQEESGQPLSEVLEPEPGDQEAIDKLGGDDDGD